MRIGFEAKRYFHNFTGLGNYSRDLIRALAKYHPEHEYYLYNPKKRSDQKIRLPEQAKEKLPENKFFKKFHHLWRQGMMVNQLKKDDIEVFHGLSGELPNGLAKNRIPSVVTIHDLIFMRYPSYYNFIDRKIYFQKFKSAAQRADKIVAISEQTKKDIIEFLNIKADKIQVIYQGCLPDFKIDYDDGFKSRLRQKYLLPERFLLYVGSIEARKNLKNLIKALPQVNLPLVVVGKKTAYFEEVKQTIEKHHLDNQVYFPDYLDKKELAALYQMAEVFVYPSFFEGFGIPIIEALYSKTPVVTSQSGCFPEAGGPHSVYVNPEKPASIAKGIVSIVNQPDKRHFMADEGWKYAQKFNDDVFAQKWITCYQNII
ncbi:MAG: glycosyltransferase family 1 protein [Psychroflexus sp.]|nr:glycosyltransferase family 1 protein [Psychroflexus sp.]MDR9448803.1 glycosyltransferase family 1 protein [Psychroflexus sp.]